MNNAKLWLVVKPTVGIPLFLSAVAVSSFAVHVAVLNQITWYDDYVAGRDLTSASVAPADQTIEPASYAVKNGAAALDAADQDGVIRVVLPDGRTARLIVDEPSRTAQLPTSAGN